MYGVGKKREEGRSIIIGADCGEYSDFWHKDV